MSTDTLRPEFVQSFPDDLEQGVLYVSILFRTTTHLCCCGCRNQVVMPLRPTAWSMSYDGENISMSPSVGNWSFPCRSHYWIHNNRIRWSTNWTDEQVEAGRRRTLAARGLPADPTANAEDQPDAAPSLLSRVAALVRRLLR